jgi:hypothetical protein
VRANWPGFLVALAPPTSWPRRRPSTQVAGRTTLPRAYPGRCVSRMPASAGMTVRGGGRHRHGAGSSDRPCSGAVTLVTRPAPRPDSRPSAGA